MSTQNQLLAGLRVAVSRRPFPSMKRDQVVALLNGMGAQVVNEVTASTDFLLCDEKSLNDASTPKIRSAIAFDVPVLLPGDFEKLKAGAPLAQLGFRGQTQSTPHSAPAAPPSRARTLEDRLVSLAAPPADGQYGANF